eukprot:CAMPEP_0202943272 /NCGR_PEP_ID=MMETSP1395-20130829/3653_1 /ASSEMBLY_ACC=CAM_ASM_000871 /TAXON_ID=5961 /ORGANISM="Blepharisma japonicum, Strain Stock R1072" /LENGTH=106 /DNA_ID=CAMNT_0049640525 /DNA_START=15 /DNA_END=332 /DNA_ORIENTATION=-
MIEGFDGKEEIALEIRAAVLQKIVLYMKHYKDLDPPKIEKPLRATIEEILPAWDADFINLEHEMLFELTIGASFLAINPLLDLTNAKIASLIKGKTPEEIKSIFNI